MHVEFENKFKISQMQFSNIKRNPVTIEIKMEIQIEKERGFQILTV